LTLTGAMLGTPGYMAPEQAEGRSKRLTIAADVWGLGAILYAALTGRPPFTAETAVQTAYLVVHAEPDSPAKFNPRIDRDLETICLKCLEKQPAGRYGSAEALAEDLERWLRGETIAARSVGMLGRTLKWVRRQPALAGLLAAAVVAALALAGL